MKPLPHTDTTKRAALVSFLAKVGWVMELIYLSLPSVDVSRSRVAERVAHGGHNIPEEIIVRRFPKSVTNLLNHYAPFCQSTICLDNFGSTPILIFTENAQGRVVVNQILYETELKGTEG